MTINLVEIVYFFIFAVWMPQHYGKLISNFHMYNVNPTNQWHLCLRAKIAYQRVLFIFSFHFSNSIECHEKIDRKQLNIFIFTRLFFQISLIEFRKICRSFKKSILTFVKEIYDLNFLLSKEWRLKFHLKCTKEN